VVESVQDLRAIEATAQYRGRYHVLHGALAPLDGIGPEDLKIAELMPRIAGGVTEVILATNADVEGDATALYLAKLINSLEVQVTRLASGIPLGGELEYIDQATLGRALAERRPY
jgi:recombination protein RecR